MDRKTFQSKLSGMIRSARNMRETLQALLVAALEHYDQHGDTEYLTQIMEKAVGVKAIPTITINDYIKAHANVKYVKVKEGKTERKVYKKVDKKEPVKVTVPTEAWYEWSGSRHNRVQTDFDWRASLHRTLTTMKKRIKEGHIKDPDEAQAAFAELEGLAYKYAK